MKRHQSRVAVDPNERPTFAMNIEVDPGYMRFLDEALCANPANLAAADLGPQSFVTHPEQMDRDEVGRALSLCHRCPVDKGECVARVTRGNNQHDGIMAGRPWSNGRVNRNMRALVADVLPDGVMHGTISGYKAHMKGLGGFSPELCNPCRLAWNGYQSSYWRNKNEATA